MNYVKAIGIGVATTLIAMVIWAKFIAPAMNGKKAAAATE